MHIAALEYYSLHPSSYLIRVPEIGTRMRLKCLSSMGHTGRLYMDVVGPTILTCRLSCIADLR